METKSIKISLEACRVNAGLKQSELAEKLNVSNITISNWENGKGEPTMTQLRIISELSGIPMDFIFISSNPKKMDCTSCASANMSSQENETAVV